MRLLDCYLAPYIETEIKKITPEMIEHLASQIKEIFLFCFIWSIGCTTTQVGRDRFDKFMREQIPKTKISFPEENSIYDWFWNTETKEW